MKVNVLFFGSLTDIAGNSMQVNNVNDLYELMNELRDQFPALKSAKYIMAVDKEVVDENVLLRDGSVVALLPAFSGG